MGLVSQWVQLTQRQQQQHPGRISTALGVLLTRLHHLSLLCLASEDSSSSSSMLMLTQSPTVAHVWGLLYGPVFRRRRRCWQLLLLMLLVFRPQRALCSGLCHRQCRRVWRSVT